MSNEVDYRRSYIQPYFLDRICRDHGSDRCEICYGRRGLPRSGLNSGAVSYGQWMDDYRYARDNRANEYVRPEQQRISGVPAKRYPSNERYGSNRYGRFGGSNRYGEPPYSSPPYDADRYERYEPPRPLAEARSSLELERGMPRRRIYEEHVADDRGYDAPRQTRPAVRFSVQDEIIDDRPRIAGPRDYEDHARFRVTIKLLNEPKHIEHIRVVRNIPVGDMMEEFVPYRPGGNSKIYYLSKAVTYEKVEDWNTRVGDLRGTNKGGSGLVLLLCD